MNVVRTGLVVALLAAVAASAEAGQVMANIDSLRVVAGNNAFAVDLYARLREGKGNLFFSPYSISSALAMTYAGARGQTAAQMAKTLHLGIEQDRVPRSFADIADVMGGPVRLSRQELTIANAVWVQKDSPLRQEFLSTVQRSYRATAYPLDFATAAEEARETINAWVQKQTRERIKDLVPPGAVTAATRLVLTNAIYFLAHWAKEFTKEGTREEPFALLSGERVNAPMMHGLIPCGYCEYQGLQVLQMPYKGGGISMFILLPTKPDGLPELEKVLTPAGLDQCFASVAPQDVIVILPKFRATSAFDLGGTLKAMGMTDAFSWPGADFSGITGKQDLFISAVVHKAYVDVDEAGTEAAAATAVVMAAGAAPGPPPPPKPIFRADHPFLFLLRDRDSGSILFLGRLANPKE